MGDIERSDRVWTLVANKRRGLEGAPIVLDGPRLSLYESVEVVPAADCRGAVDALYTAHDFISRVLKWEGTDDTEQSEVLAELAQHLPSGGQ